MAFHKIRAYFTGFKYEPDPQPESDEPQQDRPLDLLQSIVETIVREKAEQAPEDQATTAEGDTTFTDLIEQHEEEATLAPDPLPSVLDGFQAPGEVEFAGIPVDRLTGDEEGAELEGQLPDGQLPDGQLPDGQLPDGQPDEEMLTGMGQGGDSLGRALQGQPEEADRLGLDSLFGQPQPSVAEPQVPEGDSATGGMFGDEPGYEDLVGQALGGPSPDGDPADQALDAPEGEPELLDEAEDLLPDSVEDISGPIDRGDHNFLKTLLLAEEREAEAAVRRVLAASDVTININIGEGGEVDINEEGLGDELGDELEGEEGFGDELEGEEGLGDELEGEEGLGDELEGEEGLGDELEGLGDELGEEELPELESSREADAIVRKVLASDVTININIGDGEEALDEEPLDLEPPGEPELGEEPELGVEGLGEELEGEEGLGEELGEELGGPAKKGENETFDELNDVGDVFDEGEPTGDKDDEISDFGV